MKARKGKRTKDEELLIGVAESIGSTLGTIAAKADAAQKLLAPRHVVDTVEREGKKLLQKSKRMVRQTKRAATSTLRNSKAGKATRRGLRRASASAKRTARRGSAKARTTRRARGKR
jgi:hypothetical protein